MYAETSGTSTESGKLISINGIQYVVSYGSAKASADKTAALTATNTKLPQTSLTVEKQWQNMDGKTSDEITKDHTETISVYLKRFTKDSSGKEENVGYYKLSDEVVSFVGSQDDATAIELTNANSYKATVSGLDQYLITTVADDGTYTTTPYYFELVSESGSWSTTSTDSTSSTSSTDSTSSTASTTSSTAGTGSTTSDTTSTSSTAGTTSSADTSSGSASESGGKITLNGKTYIVTYGASAASTDTSPTVTVTNKYSPVFTLPVTGGRGRNILLGILGGAAVLAAVLYWNIRKTRRRKFRRE